MKQSFNLIREYVTKSVNSWNEMQADNNTLIKVDVNEDCESFTLWDDKDPETFCPIGSLSQGVQALGYSYFFKWNETHKRVVMIIF